MHGGCILFTCCHFYMMESVALVIIHNWSGNDMHCHLVADLGFYYFVHFFGWTWEVMNYISRLYSENM